MMVSSRRNRCSGTLWEIGARIHAVDDHLEASQVVGPAAQVIADRVLRQPAVNEAHDGRAALGRERDLDLRGTSRDGVVGHVPAEAEHDALVLYDLDDLARRGGLPAAECTDLSAGHGWE